MSLSADLLKGIGHGLSLSKRHILDSFVKVPIGIIIMLMVLYGVNEIILLTKIKFPASVTCMLLLYFVLIISTWIFGSKKVSKMVKVIEIPGGFALRWINIFFTPAFITLPMSEWISAKEALTIAAVFIFGYLIAFASIAYFTMFLQSVLRRGRKSDVVRADELDPLEPMMDGSSTAVNGEDDSDSDNAMANLYRVPQGIVHDIARGDEDSLEEQYRRSMAESRRNSDEGIDMNSLTHTDDSNSLVQVQVTTTKDSKTINFPSKPTPVKAATRPSNPGVDVKFNKLNKLFCKRSVLNQSQPDIATHVKIGRFIHRNFDYLVFTCLFITGIPIYFAIPYEMPVHLFISIFTFLFMINVPPPKYKKFLHPVLCSVCLSWLGYFIFSSMKHENFLVSLKYYKTGRNYLNLFNRKDNDSWPGAGDVFSSLMDCSIVSLSIPMYTYRGDLKRHFVHLLPPILVMSFGNFFIYPPLCYKLGISPQRSLGFAGRSVTLALGTPFVQSLEGSIPLMAITTVVTGIIGALTGQVTFKLLRIRGDDYVTRGITLGCNSSAIATAHLLTIDPRAAAMSSLSFVLFGTLMVIMGSITPLAQVARNLVGL